MERTTAGVRAIRMKAKRITAMGWGLFFIWLGAVLMFNAGIGLILIGVGIISLGMQVSRKYAGLETDGFWILVAILFVAVGIWELFELKLPLMSLFLIVVGVALLVSAWKGVASGTWDIPARPCKSAGKPHTDTWIDTY